MGMRGNGGGLAQREPAQRVQGRWPVPTIEGSDDKAYPKVAWARRAFHPDSLLFTAWSPANGRVGFVVRAATPADSLGGFATRRRERAARAPGTLRRPVNAQAFGRLSADAGIVVRARGTPSGEVPPLACSTPPTGASR